MRDAFINYLVKEGHEDPNLVLLSGDLGFGAFDVFRREHKDKFINIGIAEQNMTSIAAGMALEGFRVFTYSIGNFNTLRCLEQIRNDICYHNLDVTIVSVGAGFSYGQLGSSHFCTEDISIMRSLPNMTVLSPSENEEVSSLLSQVKNLKTPKYLRLDKSIGGQKLSLSDVDFGTPRRARDGNDVTIFCTGGIIKEAFIAADQLTCFGVSTRIISMHTLKPIKIEEVFLAFKESKAVITLEEHVLSGGLGSLISEIAFSNNFPLKKVCRLGIPDIFPDIVGDQNFLRRNFNLDSKHLVNTVKEILQIDI